MCCPTNKVIKSDTKRFLALGGLHEGMSCGILQAMAPTNVETVFQTSSFHIESYSDRLELLVPQITLQSVLINKPKFLKAKHHTEIVKKKKTRSMVVVEALSW